MYRRYAVIPRRSRNRGLRAGLVSGKSILLAVNVTDNILIDNWFSSCTYQIAKEVDNETNGGNDGKK